VVAHLRSHSPVSGWAWAFTGVVSALEEAGQVDTALALLQEGEEGVEAGGPSTVTSTTG